VRVQPIEHRRGRCDALIVVACAGADAVDRAAHSCGLQVAGLRERELTHASSAFLPSIDAFFSNLNWAVLDKRWQAARR
jgi:hypothetical protein